MLLIDGVKYELWTPQKEKEEFHPLVKEHYREIFGTNSIFIEGNRLESESGKGSVPDGFVVTLGEKSQWHIVEMELSTHQLYDHIVNQVGRFISGVKNTATQKKIIEAIYRYIQDNKQRKAEFEEAIGSGEIYKFLSDLITKPPVLVIIIEEKTRELDEALDLLKYSPIEIVEFQTFTREGVGLAVHAHLLEPLYKPTIPIEPKPRTRREEILPSVEIILSDFWIKRRHIYIPANCRDLFPDSKSRLVLETNIGVVEANLYRDAHHCSIHSEIIRKWFDTKNLEAGDKVRFTVIEPMKKYHLEIV